MSSKSYTEFDESELANLSPLEIPDIIRRLLDSVDDNNWFEIAQNLEIIINRNPNPTTTQDVRNAINDCRDERSQLKNTYLKVAKYLGFIYGESGIKTRYHLR